MLDLFSGTGSMSAMASQLGFTITTVDSREECRPDYCVDVRDWKYKSAGVFDWVHMSPPCTEYSMLKTRGTRDLTTANEVSMKSRTILEYFLKLNPKMVFTVENPSSSLLQHQDAVKGLPVHETSYCAYGFPYRKQTKIWSNIAGLRLKTCEGHCFWGKTHPTNVQDSPPCMRIKIPACLCLEIAMAAAFQLGCMPRASIPLRKRQLPSCHSDASPDAPGHEDEPLTDASRKPRHPKRPCECEKCGSTNASLTFYHRSDLSKPVLCRGCYRAWKSSHGVHRVEGCDGPLPSASE